MANVLFKVGTREQFNNIVEKSANTLYWLTDTQELYKGNVLFGTGAFASDEVSGLLSAEDYKKLQELIKANGVVNLSPVDGSIVIESNKIGVNLSAVEGNMLSIKDDGLFVPAVDLTKIESKLTAVEGSITQLQEDIVGGIRYKGAVATVDELPTNAKQGDLYEVTADGSEWCYNGETWFEYGSAHFTPVAGNGIQINGNEIAVKIAAESHGLVAVEGGELSIAIATAKNDGAMSKEDKAFIDAIPHAYVAKKYEITGAPNGTLVNYYEKEIRIMCPVDAEYNLQNVGAGGDANTYYVTLNTFAPDGAVGYVEHLAGQTDPDILNDIKVDKYGRRYQPTWLGVAKNADGVWTYYGVNSDESHYIGWDYQIDWYDADGVMISSDNIRINLSNEDCHFTSEPYYMAGYAESAEVAELKATIAELEQSYSWGEM